MIALFLAGGVKGIIGLGLPLTALSIIGAVADLRLAIALIAIPIIATNIYQAFYGGRTMEMLRRYWVINLCSVVGTVIGAQILFMVDPNILTTTLGVIVIVYVAINATGFAIRISDSASPWAAPPLGILSGLLTGTTGSVGIPIALYLQARGLDKESFLRAIALTFLISASMLVIALLEKGAIGKETALLSAASLIPAFAGMAIGQRLRGRLSEDLFRKFVFLFLMVAAANLIRKGLF
ncbi:MAG: sulfite exporter TauE/SafE family protein [Pseudomonadota bacterium]|nr:sulfite exporter TauE/SafE family protein [Pseudomonadota bacterium]